MSDSSFFTSRLDEAIGWARKYSIFQYPFVTACCGMEYMATACSHYDVDRFGAGLPRFSPRQADVLFVVDTIMPVDVYIPGCPPRPEYVLDGLLKLQAKIQAQHSTGQRAAPEPRPEF